MAAGERSFLLLLFVFFAHLYTIFQIGRAAKTLSDLGNMLRSIGCGVIAIVEVTLMYMLFCDALTHFTPK